MGGYWGGEVKVKLGKGVSSEFKVYYGVSEEREVMEVSLLSL